LYRAFLSPQLVFPDKGEVCGKGGFTGDLVGSFAGSWAIGQLGSYAVGQLGSKFCQCQYSRNHSHSAKNQCVCTP